MANKSQEIPTFTNSSVLAKVEAALAESTEQQQPEAAPVAPPPNLFSGTTKKLDVFGKPGSDPTKPVAGHELYWFPDDQGGLMINQALASGWVFVEKEEVALNDANVGPGNTALDNKVRKWVGHGPDGNPIFNYLMKKPDWLHELHMTGPDSLEVRVHQQQEAQLAMGTYNNRDLAHTYTAARAPGAAPGIRSGLPSIKIGRYAKPS